jgi:hypothetical protein
MAREPLAVTLAIVGRLRLLRENLGESLLLNCYALVVVPNPDQLSF